MSVPLRRWDRRGQRRSPQFQGESLPHCLEDLQRTTRHRHLSYHAARVTPGCPGNVNAPRQML